MKTRKLGSSDLEFTTVGLGTWAIGGPWEFGWGPQDDQDSLEAIYEAIDMGVNWIDTAAIYGHGHSEEVIGKALKEMSEKPLIATKCGLRWDQNHERIQNLKPESIRQECDESLERLGIDAIDLYQIHWPTTIAETLEAWGEVANLIKKGKVRYGGVSNFSVEQIRKCHEVHPVTSLQPPYNMLTREIENEIIGFCQDKNIGIVAYSPMARGLLTGKFSHEKLEKLAPDDHRRKDKMFQEPEFSKNLELVEKLRPIADRNGKSLAQLAVAWVINRGGITSAIVGARRPGQIEETAQAGDWVIDQNEMYEINNIIKQMEV